MSSLQSYARDSKGCNLYQEVHRAHFGVAYVQKSAKEMDQQATRN